MRMHGTLVSHSQSTRLGWLSCRSRTCMHQMSLLHRELAYALFFATRGEKELIASHQLIARQEIRNAH